MREVSRQVGAAQLMRGQVTKKRRENPGTDPAKRTNKREYIYI